MKKSDYGYLMDMYVHALKIQAHLAGQTFETFKSQELLYVAVTHWLIVIGEAANRISPAFQAANPAIPWRKMIGMRNVLVHNYRLSDNQIIWETATSNLPPLLRQLEGLIAIEEKSAEDAPPDPNA